MKRLSMICMAALLMMAVSCKKENKTNDKGEGFHATIESHSGNGKTHLEGLNVKWNNGDAIKVLSNTCPDGAVFSTDAASSPALFEAAGDLPANFYTPTYTAYYPANSFNGNQLTLPAIQQYDENNTFASGANPMVAQSASTDLPFKNVCGMLKLQLYNEDDDLKLVRRISITTDNGEQLWGTGTVTLTDGIPALGTLTGGSNTLILDMGETGKPLSIDYDLPTCFYFVVPAGTLGYGFTVKLTDTEGNVGILHANGEYNHDNLIARSQITVMPKRGVWFEEPVSPVSVTITGSYVDCIYTISGSVTVPPRNIKCEYGLVYSDTDNTPTIEEGASKLVVNNEYFNSGYEKDFTADLTGLTAGKTYYVRAYATMEGTIYSSDILTVTHDAPMPLPSNWVNGKNPHPFSVASGKQVYFSQGNLQYIGSAATPYWKFADYQFYFLGKNGQASDATNVDRDLFGWGTSGWYNGNTYYQPYDIILSITQYGPIDGSLTGKYANADWGVYNAIRNGGNTAGSWRTLSYDEWYYLIKSRTNAADLFGMGKVGKCNTPGLIILPDGWSWSGDVASLEATWVPGDGQSSWLNFYSYSDWAKMEAAGAVFLPAAGIRIEKDVDDDEVGFYWTTSSIDEEEGFAYVFDFIGEDILSGTPGPRALGFSVRLVSDN